MTVRESVIQKLLEELNTGRPSDISEFQRTHFVAIETTAMPVAILAPFQDTSERSADGLGPVVLRRMRLAIRVYVRQATGPSPLAVDAAVEPILAWATKKLVGKRVAGVLVDIVEAETSWEYIQSSSPVCVATMEIVAVYQTRFDDAELWA